MKNFVKRAGAFTLTLVIVLSCTCGAFASSFWSNPDPEDKIEEAAENFADQLENLLEKTGEDYEENAEDFPENPNPYNFMKNVFSYSNNFLNGFKSLFNR